MLRDKIKLSKVHVLEPQDELKLAVYMLERVGQSGSIDQARATLGNRFLDISAEPESIGRWAGLIHTFDSAFMWAFNTAHSNYGEVEFIFKTSKLVQSGLLITFESDAASYFDELFNKIKTAVSKDFLFVQASDRMFQFSNGAVMGYAAFVNSALTFRMGDLGFCETDYGPNVQVPVSF